MTAVAPLEDNEKLRFEDRRAYMLCRAVDTNGTGRINGVELNQVLERAGLSLEQDSRLAR